MTQMNDARATHDGNSMDAKFPKLLVVAEFPPNVPDGGGALARQMLRGYPAGRVFWWSCLHGMGGHFRQEFRAHFRFPLPSRLIPQRRCRAVKAWFLEHGWTRWAARHLAGVVSRVDPQQVWAILHGWAIPAMDRARIFSGRRCHVSVWDYQDHLLSQPRFGTAARAAHVARTVESIYQAADTCDAVSRPMWEDLAERTGRRDAIVVHSGVEPLQLEATTLAEEERQDDEIRIAYAGAIIAAGTFALCVQALESIRSRLGKPLRLEFYGGGPVSEQPWFNPEWMRVNGTLDETKLNQALRRCQWGLISMDLTDDNARYNRFSIPNKFGTYLAAGLPIAVVGHHASSAARTARHYGLGFWTDAANVPALGEALHGMCTEARPRARYREAILRCVREEFDVALIRGRLWDCWGVPR